MSDFFWFIIGMFAGGTMGFLTAALLAAARDEHAADARPGDEFRGYRPLTGSGAPANPPSGGPSGFRSRE